MLSIHFRELKVIPKDHVLLWEIVQILHYDEVKFAKFVHPEAKETIDLCQQTVIIIEKVFLIILTKIQ
jgi:hypothetical protein